MTINIEKSNQFQPVSAKLINIGLINHSTLKTAKNKQFLPMENWLTLSKGRGPKKITFLVVF